jgi:ribonuclease-3
VLHEEGTTSVSVSPQPRYEDLQKALAVQMGAEILERAVTHRSYAYENGGLPTNERLEFLGDSVLGLVVTDALYLTHPDLPEGQLAKLRASVVNMKALAGVARGLGLGGYLRLGKGEETTGGRDKSSILADTLEALIGAVYLDRGLEVASALVHRLFDPLLADSATRGAGLDWKTSLQELTAAELLGVPDYLVEESGPDHQKHFRATARVAGRSWGDGEGNSKKEAEQRAAEAAWGAIRAEVTARVAESADTPTDGGDEAAQGRAELAGLASVENLA